MTGSWFAHRASDPGVRCGVSVTTRKRKVSLTQPGRERDELSLGWHWETDAAHCFTSITDAHGTVAGVGWIGRHPWKMPGVTQPENAWANLRRLMARHGRFSEFEYVVRQPGKPDRWVAASGVPVFDAAAAFTGYRGTARFITERKLIEIRLRESEERFRRLTALAADWYWECDPQWRLTFLSESFRERTGIDPASRMGLSVWGEREEDFDPGVRTELMRTVHARLPFAGVEYLRVFPDGRRLWRSMSGEPFFDPSGIFLGYRGTARDITARRETVERLRVSEERFRRLSAIATDWFWELDDELRVQYVSPSYFAVTGTNPDALLGQKMTDILAQLGDGGAIREIILALEGRRRYRDREYAALDPDGVLRWRSVSGDPVFDAQGVFQGFRGVGRDTTERKRAEEELRRLAQHDALTGLANRTLLRDRLDHAIANAQRSGAMLAVMLLDLDHFKAINDGLGHDIGDELLIDIAGRLPACVRAGDTVGRLGGDEFVLLFENVESVDFVAAAAARVLDTVAAPCIVSFGRLDPHASLGISLYPRDGEDANTLLRHADTAMYEAKRAGRGVLRFFTLGSGGAGQRVHGMPVDG